MLHSSLRRRLLKWYEWVRPPKWRETLKSETGASVGSVSIESSLKYVVWEEPNRADSPPLHIGTSGERYSTVTGVWWLDPSSLVVAHRDGLRIGVFETDRFDAPVLVSEVAHLTDDIAAKPIGAGVWEVAVSGCWTSIYSRFTLRRTADGLHGWTITPLDTKVSPTKDFCHGIAYNKNGQLCWSIHTGKAPRFTVGDALYSLPPPWGVRDICDDRARGRHLAVAVSANPKRAAYQGVVTTIWYQADTERGWHCLAALQGVHADALDVWGKHIWIPDQLGDRLLAIDADTGEITAIYSGNCLDFPHGLGISEEGLMAVTNYGSSSIVLLDVDALLTSVAISTDRLSIA